MKSRASVARHPIHPMLVPLPIGLWIFSLICDIISSIQQVPIWSSVALYTMVAGFIGAVLAVVPGLIDLLCLTPSPVKRVGIWHMTLNLTVAGLYLVNALLRGSKTGPTGGGMLALSAVAVLILAVAGWLGGELVYVHGVAVDPVNGRKKSTLGSLVHPE